jgi:hypothetical protein
MTGVAHPDGKAFATLQAKAAIAGWQVERMADGSIVVARWTLTRSLPDVAALAEFLREVGAA